jgi:hypothetical protein
MKRIPLYDATEPIACSLDPDDVPARLALIERIRANLQWVDRVEHGLLLHLPDQVDVEADVREFAVVEKQCCAFWGFAVERTGGGLALRWEAPPSAGDLLERLHHILTSDEPIASIEGLL